MKDPYGRRGRMLSDIAEFDFDIEHMHGGEEKLLADTPWIIKNWIGNS